jgi:pyruvate,water dikinase
LYDYTCDGSLPSQAQHIWSRGPLNPFPDILTPFSYSVLAEITARAWFRYYDRLGHEITLRSKTIMRHHYGRPYLNLRWINQQDSSLLGLRPMRLDINGEGVPLAQWEKPGLLDGFRLGRSQRRLNSLLNDLDGEVAAITQKARNWYLKVNDLRWSQAEVLQIMEEIERFGTESLMAYYAARHNLSRAYNSLLDLIPDTDAGSAIQAVNNTLSDLHTLEEIDLTDGLMALAGQVAQKPAWIDWLTNQESGDWRESLPDDDFGRALGDFMDRYGHRAMGEGEMANPRWGEQPGFLFKSILACAECKASQPKRVPSTAALTHLLGMIDRKQHKEAQALVEQIRQLITLQSRALHAFSFILAGTRRWARAAGREAMSDQRLLSEEEAFFFELEELKQMMTGEWNIANLDEIRQLLAERQAMVANWERAQPGDLLFDDAEAYPTRSALPGVAGEVSGPLRRQQRLQPILCEQAIVGTQQLDSGWAISLPLAAGLICATGSPLDPIVAAARVWHVPTVIRLGPHYNTLTDGALTKLDGGAGKVSQT